MNMTSHLFLGGPPEISGTRNHVHGNAPEWRIVPFRENTWRIGTPTDARSLTPHTYRRSTFVGPDKHPHDIFFHESIPQADYLQTLINAATKQP